MKLTKLTKLTKATRHMLDCTIRAILPLPHVTPHVHAHPARRRPPGAAPAVWAGGHLFRRIPLLTSSRGGRHFRRRRALARKIQQQTPAAQISEITRLLKYTVSRRVTRIFTRDPPRASEIYFTAQSKSEANSEHPLQQRRAPRAKGCRADDRMRRRRDCEWG